MIKQSRIKEKEKEKRGDTQDPRRDTPTKLLSSVQNRRIKQRESQKVTFWKPKGEDNVKANSPRTERREDPNNIPVFY